MLPTHRNSRKSPTKPRFLGGNARRYLGRPSFRWFVAFIALGVLLWLFSPALLHPRWRPPLQPLILPSNVEEASGENAMTSPPSALGNPNVPVTIFPSNPIDNVTATYFIPESDSSSMNLWSERANRVREAFIHAYSGYQEHAAPYDELRPVSGGKVNNFNGWGVSTFDSLDTMWIMGLRREFNLALSVVARSSFFMKPTEFAPFFETVIRYLGGLLSAYTLSGEPVLLARADDLGRMLLPALNTTSGFPMYAVNTETGQTRMGWTQGVLWAEALSCQLEYKYLAHLTGRSQYYHKVEHIMKAMYVANVSDGQFPTIWDIELGIPKNTQFSVGAYADSAHEYLLKQWLLTGKSEPKAKELYLNATAAIMKHLLYITPNRNLLYVTDSTRDVPSNNFEHLSCFLPGLLALGVQTLDLSPRDKELHGWAAEGLAYTCWMTYADQATGLGPDQVTMVNWPTGTDKGRWIDHIERWEEGGREGGVPPGLREVSIEKRGKRDYTYKKATYLLRPEAVESFYLLWRTTGNSLWRERGWAVFEAIEKHCKTDYGYASVGYVDELPARKLDEMPSYFLAETLKYLYLLFIDEDLIPLDQWVFNTEAHPLPIFEWAQWERDEYEIA